MSDRNSPGDKLSRRLMARTSGVAKRQMADGGSVVTGPAVRQALRAVGARAFTWDKEIYVDEDFDASDAKDQALYAHERFHQRHSGGSDVGTGHTSSVEERGAQAVERMVLHRVSAGEDAGAVMRDAVSTDVHRAASGGGAAVAAGPKPGNEDTPASDGAQALQALLDEGRSYRDVVDTLARKCITKLQEQREGELVRNAASGE